MKMTVYIPDDLAAEIKDELGDANISAICQQALRGELARTRAWAKISGGGFERIRAMDYREDPDGHGVAFQGQEVGTHPDHSKSVYVTPKGALVVAGDAHDGADELLAVYRTLGDFADDGLMPYSVVTQVAQALGEEPPVEELDI
jgi:hypothetical protein